TAPTKSGRIQPWYVLGCEHTSARVALLQGRFDEAIAIASRALKDAEHLRNFYYATLLKLTIADAQLRHPGGAAVPVTLPLEWNPDELPLTVMGAHRLVLARGLISRGIPADFEMRRAALILSTSGDDADWRGR